MGGACNTYGGGEKRGAYRVLMGKPDGERPLAKPMLRLNDNIKMDIQEVGWGGMDWFDLNLDKWQDVVYTVTNLRIP
jgi:hypothetical protein